MILCGEFPGFAGDEHPSIVYQQMHLLMGGFYFGDELVDRSKISQICVMALACSIMLPDCFRHLLK